MANRAGFLLIEVLVALALITVSTVLLIRFEQNSGIWRGLALKNMAVVDQAVELIESIVANPFRQIMSSEPQKISVTYKIIAEPCIVGAPAQFSRLPQNIFKMVNVTMMGLSCPSVDRCQFSTLVQERMDHL